MSFSLSEYTNPMSARPHQEGMEGRTRGGEGKGKREWKREGKRGTLGE